MKYLIPIVIMILAISTVTAMSTPMPVSVKITNEGVLSGYEITQRNTRTGEIIKTVTDGSGFALYDWSNSEFKWFPGDTIEIQVTSCKDYPSCTQDVKIDSQGSPIYVQIDLTSEVPPECPDCPTCPDPVVCPEPTICPEPEVCPADTTPYAECDSCCAEPECPPATTEALIYMLVTGILGAAGGAAVFTRVFNNRMFTGMRTGMKVYRGLDGEIKVFHKHPGTKGYHDPNTVHRGKEAHPKGMIDVADKYKKVDGQWVYGGN